MLAAITRRSCFCASKKSYQRFASSSAVVFDVDGVLVRGNETVSAAPDVLRGLVERDVPFLVMTNGGGVDESVRAIKLSERFGVEIGADQIIQSHTPMKDLVQKYANDPVLLVGKHYDKLAHLADAYGFRYPVTVEQYHSQTPLLYPDMEPVESPPLPRDLDLSKTPIKAVLALTDPIMWGRELQICCDVLRQGVPLYSSCADFIYAAEYTGGPRFGSGAFMTALQALYDELSSIDGDGAKLSYVQYGKPWSVTFSYARRVLEKKLGSSGANSLKRVYMVGDNPETDIRGANDAGDPWFSVLTRSGLFQGDDNHPIHPGAAVVDDVGGLLKLVDDFEATC